MAVCTNLARLCKVPGTYRSVLLPRALPSHNLTSGIKQSVEEKLGIPPKPKKPLTPYFRFMAQVRPTLIQKNPQAKVTEIAKMAGELWEKAEPTVRQQLENDYKHAMSEYLQAMAKYEGSLTVEQKEEILNAKESGVQTKEKRRLKKKMKEMGKPKKPVAPFLAYLLDRQSSKGDLSFREFQANLAKEWENLPLDIKSRYSEQSRKAMEVYKRDLQKWEEKMIRLGHIDLVRNEALIISKSFESPSRRTKVEE